MVGFFYALENTAKRSHDVGTLSPPCDSKAADGQWRSWLPFGLVLTYVSYHKWRVERLVRKGRPQGSGVLMPRIHAVSKKFGILSPPRNH